MNNEEIKNSIKKIDEKIGSEPIELDKKKKGLAMIKKIENNLDGIIDKLESNKIVHVDTKKELNIIKDKISDVKAIDEKKYFEKIVNELTEIYKLIEFLIKKDDKKELVDIVRVIQGIKIPNQSVNTENIIKAIKKGAKESKSENYNIVLDKILDNIVEIKKESKAIKEVKVKNFSEQLKEVKVSNFPKSDYSLIVKVVESLSEKIKKVGNFFVRNKKPKEAISVRLVNKDGDYFYDAMYFGSNGFRIVGIYDSEDLRINPATKEKQDDIREVLDNIKAKTDNLTSDPAT
ncbi:MAG: hypothetical protein KAR81_04275, partial [Sulfurimonas sp.]|nr:hypothetical protein [Sulfurimonas sp.]